VRMTSPSIRDSFQGHLRAQDAGTGTLKLKAMKRNPRDQIPSQAPHVSSDSRFYRLSSFTSERGGKMSTSTIISSFQDQLRPQDTGNDYLVLRSAN
jgi:hypothetical protein